MSDTPTARDLFERFQKCAVHQDWQAFGDLFAEDGTMEFPFVAPEVASRYEGREAIRTRARLAWGQSPLRAEEFCSVVAEEGANPDVLFAEYEVRGKVLASNEPFRVPAAIVLRARGGVIVSMREYLDPIALVKATGRAEALAANLLGELGAGSRRTPARLVAGGANAEASQALVQRYFAMWNSGQSAEADALLAASYLDHAHPGVIGPAAVRSLVRRFRAEHPAARMSIEVVAFDAEFVVVRRVIRWKAKGEAEACGIALFRVAEGQLTEQWSWSPSPRRAAVSRAREAWEEAVVRAPVREQEAEGVAERLAAEGLLERPFAPLGVHGRLEGRDEIRRLLSPAPRAANDVGRRVTGYEPVVVHNTEDPEVVVVEFDLHGVDAAGAAYRLPYLQIVRVREGRVRILRDYFDAFGAVERTLPGEEAASPAPAAPLTLAAPGAR